MKVVVRIRPLSSKEVQDGHEAVAVAIEDRGVIEVKNPSHGRDEPPKTFTFDAVFSNKSTQKQVRIFGAMSHTNTNCHGMVLYCIFKKRISEVTSELE